MTHAYDTANRLITTINADDQDWGTPPASTSWYTFDDVGNRISHKYRTTSAVGNRRKREAKYR